LKLKPLQKEKKPRQKEMEELKDDIREDVQRQKRAAGEIETLEKVKKWLEETKHEDSQQHLNLIEHEEDGRQVDENHGHDPTLFQRAARLAKTKIKES
jgi:hypothetical protein